MGAQSPVHATLEIENIPATLIMRATIDLKSGDFNRFDEYDNKTCQTSRGLKPYDVRVSRQ